jgi:AraC-like DNA-binding protein
MFNGIEYGRSAAGLPIMVTSSGSSRWGDKRAYRRDQSEIFGLELVLAGSAIFNQNNREYTIPPGGVFILRKGGTHWYRTGKDGFLVKRFLTFDGPVLDQIVQAVGLESYDVVKPEDTGVVRRCFKKINILLREKPRAFASSASRVAYELLIELGRSVSPQLPRPVRIALEFMQRHLDQSHDSLEIARVAGLSATHFNRVFRAHLGTSPKAYFNRRRMEWALHLLRSTSLSVKEIALEVGFDDPFYFSARFKHAYGASPRVMRDAPGY